MNPDAVVGLMLGHDVPDIAEVLGRPTWEARAACKGLDVELFVPPLGRNGEAGRAICRRCVVREECLEYALADVTLSGIWGGTSERDRRAMRRASALQRVGTC